MKKVVAVAEDDDDLREVLISALAGEGLKVTDLEDGFELLDYIAMVAMEGNGNGPALILADVQMPGASGLEVLERARAMGVTCPVIVLTAHVDQAVRDRVTALGKAQVLAKPANLDALLAQVRAAVSDPSTMTM